MPTNKNALIRYKILDKCFRNPGRRYFINDLIDECDQALTVLDPNFSGISRRQIFEDIAFMESDAGWDIDLKKHRDGKKVYYRYADISFSINNMPLNELEVNQLRSALEILSQFKGMPQFEWVHELLPKLQQGPCVKHKKPTVIEFDSNQYLKGIEHLGTLHNAITYKKTLRIMYHPYTSETTQDIILHPYYLKQYNNRWFLFGHNEANNKYDWNMALDRIISIDEVKGRYQKNTEIDWEEYFEDIIGVTKPDGAKIETVVLQFTGKTGKYIESKPIHGSQKSKWLDQDTLEVSLKVIINYELERLILSYSDTVSVFTPAHLRNRIRKRLICALENFGVQNGCTDVI